MLSLVASEALYERDIGFERLVDVFCTTPARLFGLAPRKGAIRVGADADFAVLEPGGRRTLEASELEYHEQEPWSPFDGREICGRSVYTISRGRLVSRGRAARRYRNGPRRSVRPAAGGATPLHAAVAPGP